MYRTRARSIAIAVTLASSFALVVSACSSSDEEEPGAPRDAGADRVRALPKPKDSGVPRDVGLDVAPTDAAACNVRVDLPPLMESPHVPDGFPVTYNSNPPSSGPHYGTWANFQEYTQPVDDRYLVHAMEHGAVLLLYDCEGAACAPIIEALRKIREAVPTDPLCDPSIRVRIILAPRPGNDDPVAAAAWGATYRATCVDTSSLLGFVLDHYSKAPEAFCTPGMSF